MNISFLTQSKELHKFPYPVEQVVCAEPHIEPMHKAKKQQRQRDGK